MVGMSSRRLSLVLSCIFCSALVACDGDNKTTPKQFELTAEQVREAMKSRAEEFCVVGIDNNGQEVSLRKTPRRFPDLYQSGKFWILFRSNGGVDSEFYNDDVQAVKAVSDRGVSKFRTCPEPMTE